MPSFYVPSDFDPLTFGQVRPGLDPRSSPLLSSHQVPGSAPRGRRPRLRAGPARAREHYGGVQSLQPLDRREETSDAALDQARGYIALLPRLAAVLLPPGRPSGSAVGRCIGTGPASAVL